MTFICSFSVFLLCFLLYHMSPRDSVMPCARISVPHLLGSFSHSTTFYSIFPAYAFFHWGVFPIPTLFTQPACFSKASDWGTFPFPLLSTQPTCFSKASGWGVFPIPPLSTQSSLHMHSSIGEFCAISHFLPNPH